MLIQRETQIICQTFSAEKKGKDHTCSLISSSPPLFLMLSPGCVWVCVCVPIYSFISSFLFSPSSYISLCVIWHDNMPSSRVIKRNALAPLLIIVAFLPRLLQHCVWWDASMCKMGAIVRHRVSLLGLKAVQQNMGGGKTSKDVL